MTPSTKDALTAVTRAKRPEDLFGDLVGSADEKLAALKAKYRDLAFVVHPDRCGDDKRATDAFARLTDLHEEAERRVHASIYGTKTVSPAAPAAGPIVVSRGSVRYVIGALLGEGDLCNVYRAMRIEAGKETEVVFKIARDPRDNDLVQREAEVLKVLVPAGAPDEKFYRYLPRMLDSFRVPDPGRGPRQVNVFAFRDGHYNLAEVRAAYPKGVVLETAVWILNRLLEGIGFVHQQGYVHTALVPTNVLIHPEQHAGRLIDWCCSTTPKNAKAPAVASAWRHLYAPEILGRKRPLPESDIYMATRCIVYILGSDSRDVPLPRVDDPARASAAAPFKRFLETCLEEAPRMRPSDAWEIRKNLDALMRRWYGPPRYHLFKMPARAA